MEGAGLAPCIVSVLGLLSGGVYACVFGLLVGAVCCVEGCGPGGGVVAAVPSACMVYRSSCRRWLTRTLGAVSSYTCVVWGRWRVTVILAASFLRVLVPGMM